MYKVKVLMSTYNGEKYLEEQLKSIFNQTDVNVSLLVRDDGSNDSTLKILGSWAVNHDITIMGGENIGYAKSFMTLVNNASGADYYAFSDQDDVWLPEKLIKAITCLNSDNNSKHLYMSQAIIVDNELKPMDAKFHKRFVSIDKLVAHNFAIGCTMVFDDYLLNKLKLPLDKMELSAGHDYWVSCVACAISGDIFWEKDGYVLYRQHGNNASGKIVSVKQAYKAIKKILIKWNSVRCNIAKKIIDSYSECISNEDKNILLLAADYRNGLGNYFRMLFSKYYISNYFMADCITKLSIFIRSF